MRMAQAHVVLRPGAPEPRPSEGVEVIRAASVRRFRAWHEDVSEAERAVRAAVGAYLARAGDQARLLGPAVLVPGKHWLPGPG
jgi:hypothetical protein